MSVAPVLESDALPAVVALASQRGFVTLYQKDAVNRCPACGGEQWIIGRSSAECARCDAAIPLMHPLAPSLETAA